MPKHPRGRNYVAWVRELLVEELGEEYACEPELVDLYLLLVLTEDVFCSLENVHDAWAVWRNNSNPDHDSLVPFSELSKDVQDYDEPYRDAIRQTARRMMFPRSD